MSQAAGAAEPCKLLTEQEIGQILGSSGLKPDPLGTTGCFWKSNSNSVSLVIRPASSWPRITMSFPGVTKTSVSGLGDAASLSGPVENQFTLSVKQGANVIVLTVTGVKGMEMQRSTEESLARIALGRL